jgi:dihydrofolate synthase/folylpolyglutamate synthase
MALLIFAGEKVEMVVLEVGLGGRLDATNVVRPELCVITPIDFDHEQYLGRSLQAIAGEKAGILKPGVPAVFARQRPEAQSVLDQRAAALGISVYRTSDWRIENVEVHARGSRFEMAGPEAKLQISCPLAGEHQVENAATAALALVQLGLPPATIQEGIARTQWPGRLERVSENPDVILDGAHNPAGARALAAYIEKFYAGRRVCLIYGTMRDKAVAEIAGILFPLADQVIVTAPKQARALAPEALIEITEQENIRVASSVEEALRLARDAAKGGPIFVTGSLFLVAEARALLVPQ